MKNIAATIIEQGNGYPSIGDYVQCEGDLYRVVSTGSSITTGDVRGNAISAVLERAKWGDCEEDDVFQAKAIIS